LAADAVRPFPWSWVSTALRMRFTSSSSPAALPVAGIQPKVLSAVKSAAVS
jgi:hypothetical protein